MAIVPVPIGVGRADIPVFIDGQFLMCGKKLKQIRKKVGRADSFSSIFCNFAALNVFNKEKLWVAFLALSRNRAV